MNNIKSLAATLSGFAAFFVTVCTVFFLATSAAFAQGYIGVSYGKETWNDLRCSSDNTIKCEDTENAFKLFAGHQPSDMFAIEVGFVPAVEHTVWKRGDTEARIEASVFYVAAKGIFPMSDEFLATAKAGFQRWDFGGENEFNGSSAEDDGTDPMFGFGAQFVMSEGLTVTLDWENFDIEETDLRLISVGIQLNF